MCHDRSLPQIRRLLAYGLHLFCGSELGSYGFALVLDLRFRVTCALVQVATSARQAGGALCLARTLLQPASNRAYLVMQHTFGSTHVASIYFVNSVKGLDTYFKNWAEIRELS